MPLLADAGHVALGGAEEVWVEFFQTRHDVVAHEIAGIVVGSVAAVFAPSEFVGAGVGFYFGAGGEKERAQQWNDER